MCVRILSYTSFRLTSIGCAGTATYLTIWPADGIMRMEDVRGVYDGSYFFKVAGKRRDAYIRGGWFSSN